MALWPDAAIVCEMGCCLKVQILISVNSTAMKINVRIWSPGGRNVQLPDGVSVSELDFRGNYRKNANKGRGSY